jgi:hypothetical protein
VALVWLIGRSRPRASGSIWLAAVAAVLPDVDSLISVAPWSVRQQRLIVSYVAWHTNLQRETASLSGLVPQVLLILACLALLKARQ